MSRWNALLSILLCLTAVLAGAGCRGAAEGRRRTVIDFWSGWTGREGKAFQGVVDRFNREHPSLFVRNVSGVQDDTKTIRAIAAGIPPDVVSLWNNRYLGPLAANGALLPLDERLAADGLRERDFVPVSLEMCRYRGRLYGLPVLIDSTALFWNRAAFREAGLDPDRPPRTPAELIDDARRLTRRGAGGRLKQIGMGPSEIIPFLYATNTPLVDRAGRVAVDTPEARRALVWYRAIIDAMGGATDVMAFAEGFGQAQSQNHPFFAGQTAMMVSGEWMPYWLERYAPALDYRIGPLPRIDPHAPPTSSIVGSSLSIPSGSRHPDAAWVFARWLQTRPVQRQLAQALANLPVRRDLLADPSLVSGSRAARGYGVLLGLSASPGARAFPNLPIANLYEAGLMHARDFVVHGDKSPEQALRDLQLRLEREARVLSSDSEAAP
jgi:multiple sugar transport system substrate-binding protein